MARKGKKEAPARLRGGTGMKMRPGTYSGYEVLQWVLRKIEEEPRRLLMADWVTMFKGAWGTSGWRIPRRKIPKCGTVACMAGWIGIAGGSVDVKGTWGGIEGLGLFGRAVQRKYDAPSFVVVRADFDQLFLSSDLGWQDAVARARILAEKHKTILQTAKVKVGHGWH